MKTAGNVLTFLGVLLLSTQFSMAQIDRSKQPKPGPTPKASFPAFEQFTLKNGLKVYLIRDPRPMVTFRLGIRGGNSADGNIPGLADAAADLLTRGTTTRSAQQFAEEIDFVGGGVSASASADAISVVGSGMKKHMPVVLDLMADALKNPAYASSEVEKYRQESVTNLQSSKAEADFLSSYAVNRVLYGNTAYGQMPTEEAIKSLTPDVIRNYYRNYFIPNNSVMVVVGDLTVAELKQQLEAKLGDWKKGPEPSLPKPAFPELKGRRIILVDRPSSVQSVIRVVGKGPLYKDPARPKTSILNNILGGGSTGRLYANLRETHGYTYGAFSGFDANMHAGHYIAQAEVRNEVTDSALAEMIFEIERIQREEVPDDELRRTVQAAEGTFLMSVADPSVTAQRVLFIEQYGLPRDYYQKLVSVYKSTSKKDLTELARKYLKSDDLAIVVVGKASEVKEDLERFGKVEVWDADLNPVTAASTDIGMTAEQAWGRMVEAMGGKRKLQAVTSMKTTAKVSASQGPQAIPGSIMKVEAAPNKAYTVLDLSPYFKQETYVDGSNVVQSAGGQTQVLEGKERDAELEKSHIMIEAYAQDMGAKLSSVGKKSVDGKQTLAIKVDYPNSGSVIYYLDPTTFLPVKQELSEGPAIMLGDWRDVGEGLKLAHAITLMTGPGKIVMSDIKYEINPKVNDGMFQAPTGAPGAK